MKKQRLPRGWTEKRIGELAEYHDRQTEEEQAAEIEAAIDQRDRPSSSCLRNSFPKSFNSSRQKRTA